VDGLVVMDDVTEAVPDVVAVLEPVDVCDVLGHVSHIAWQCSRTKSPVALTSRHRYFGYVVPHKSMSPAAR
jgi:hypothetical protein